MRLGSYEVLSELGAGGMGEVYRARDTTLGRDVAIKILPSAFTADPERLARFTREARVLAALNHPHIGAIYGFEEHGGLRALVLELVEGWTLADRIAQGPLPLDTALPIAQQIAEALEAAHEKGIIHRDLKPANVKVRPDGTAKVLDFGLAKARESVAVGADLSNSPTITTPAMTQIGNILGTAAYMSPEQARGMAVDKRTDIWAFGSVLFEMLTGRPAFEGETVSDVLGAIMHKEPDWEKLPAKTPAAIRRLLRRCLAKDAHQRLHDIADARLEIEATLHEPSVELPRRDSVPAGSKRTWIAVSVLATVIAAAATYMLGRRMGGPTEEATLWTSILPPEKQFGLAPLPALSPDGRTLAFAAPNAAGQEVLWVRPLDSPTARALPGTEGGSFGQKQPFWSPDNRSLAFFTGYGGGGKLLRIDIAGGAPQFLADAPQPLGGTWSRDGTILFVPTATTIHRIPASGGSPKQVTRLDAARQETIHGLPRFLPDGRHFLCWVFSSEKQHEGVYIGTLDSGELRPLLPLRTQAEYANGYLFFGREGNLMAQPFDLRQLQLSGEATRVTEGLGMGCCELSNAAFSISDTGSIAYWSGAAGQAKTQLTWFDRAGRRSGIIGEPGYYAGFMPSPDGTYSALERLDVATKSVDIWLLDMAGGNPSRLTFVNYAAGNPLWLPDSQRVLFTQWTDRLYVKSIRSGVIEEVPFPGGTNSDFPLGWSPDGRNLLFLRNTPETLGDLWILPLSGDRKPHPYLNTSINEGDGRISPDGHWLAYAANESSGRHEVFVQSFPEPGSKIRISANGGRMPMWKKDGRELYFVTEDLSIMGVSLTAGPTSLQPSPPVRLFQTELQTFFNDRVQYAPSADGQRFLVNLPLHDDRPKASTSSTTGNHPVTVLRARRGSGN
jgi:serine/threonine protein kinase/Tol biopolymer transport system component